jgi:hypothetical protein
VPRLISISPSAAVVSPPESAQCYQPQPGRSDLLVFDNVKASMHRALLIREVVENIVRSLAASKAHDDRIALVSLACTCGIFSEPALDEIWSDCRLWHLAQTMDEDVRTVTTAETEIPGGPQKLKELVHTMVRSFHLLTSRVVFLNSVSDLDTRSEHDGFSRAGDSVRILCKAGPTPLPCPEGDHRD